MHMAAHARYPVRDFLRTAFATRSLRAARALHTSQPGTDVVRLPGFRAPFYFRTGTSDAKFLRVLVTRELPAEYELPVGLCPRTILDVGANIGAVTAALARRYRRARIYAFEPLPANYELLARNMAQFPNVAALPYGLAAETRRATYCLSDNPLNFGGGGFYGGEADDAHSVADLPLVAVPEALARLHINSVDLIKIDTEGAEYDILTSLPPAILCGVQVIVGELHGKPHDAELLDRLATLFTVERRFHRGRVQWFRATRRLDGPSPV